MGTRIDSPPLKVEDDMRIMIRKEILRAKIRKLLFLVKGESVMQEEHEYRKGNNERRVESSRAAKCVDIGSGSAYNHDKASYKILVIFSVEVLENLRKA